MPEAILKAKGWKTKGGQWTKQSDSGESLNPKTRKTLVFVSLNRPSKLTRSLLLVWCRILKRVDPSLLWLPGDSEETIAAVKTVISGEGIPEDRVVFSAMAPLQEHLER